MKKLTLLLLLFVFLSVVAADVRALGVSPGRRTLFFEPGLEESITLILLNNEGKATSVEIQVRGELADYITLDTGQEGIAVHSFVTKFAPNEASKEIRYKVRLPVNLEPGVRQAEIVARERDSGEQHAGTGVGGLTSVVSELRVRVPFPGKYAETSLHVDGDERKVSFVVPVVNLGEDAINNAEAAIQVFAPDDELLATLTTGSVSAPPKVARELRAEWIPPHKGEFYAVATVKYDGLETHDQQVFNVGIPVVRVKNIDVNNFVLGGVARFDIHLESDWNRELSGVTGSLDIKQEGRGVATLEADQTSIPAFSQQNLKAFWDTQEVEPGNYDASFNLVFGGISAEIPLRMVVGVNSIKVELVALTGKVAAVEAPSSAGSLKGVVGLVVVLNLVIVVFFVLRSRRGRKQ